AAARPAGRLFLARLVPAMAAALVAAARTIAMPEIATATVTPRTALLAPASLLVARAAFLAARSLLHGVLRRPLDNRRGEIALRLGNHPRSEERRVGKECRSRWSPD